MTDQLGNPLNVGDYVVYSTKDSSPTPGVGRIDSVKNGIMCITSKWGKRIYRSGLDVVVYKGIAP